MILVKLGLALYTVPFVTMAEEGDLGLSSGARGQQQAQPDLQAFTQLFRRAMGFHGIPHGRLSKFKGQPSRPGDLSLAEWLDEFEQVVDLYNLTRREKAQALVDHLGGDAKDEIMCLSEEKRGSCDEIVKALQLCFTSSETVQTLSSAFHTRTQQEGESLTDFSRGLMRLYGKMEAAAPTEEEEEALHSLKDSALKNQFSQGAREVWVRRELRRIVLAHPDEPFAKIREEALLLFQDVKPQRQARVREMSSNIHADVTEVAPSSQLTMQALVDSQQALLKGLSALKQEVESMKDLVSDVEELKSAVKKLQGPSPRRYRRPLSELQCFLCRKMGHVASKCSERETPAQEN